MKMACPRISTFTPLRRLSSRYTYTPALASALSYSTAATEIRCGTLGDLVTQRESAIFTSALTEKITNEKQFSEWDTTVPDKIRALLLAKKYESLLDLLLRVTSPKLATGWQSVIDHADLSSVLQHLVHYQIGLITRAGTAHMIRSHKSRGFQIAHGNEVREKLRSVYSNLLAAPGQPSGHLYLDKHLTSDFKLTSTDYENLINLELHNRKLDLASRWFQHMEATHKDPACYTMMTHKLWLLRWQVYSSAAPSLWRIPASELYEMIVDPRQSRFKSEKPWLETINEFTKHQGALLGSNKYIFGSDFLALMLVSMAYSKNLEQIYKLIEMNWGITTKGTLLSGFEKPGSADPVHPKLETLTAILVSMLSNKQYVLGMTYLNAFQTHYAIDLSLKRSKNFWNELFKWSELSTRFSEYRAFQYYIKETGISALLSPSNASELPVTLEEAKNSVDFDYEGYLGFIRDLRQQRFGLLTELWKCYQESGAEFSAKPYHVMLTLSKEVADEDFGYTFLQSLLLQMEAHKISSGSFNSSAPTVKLNNMTELYKGGMKAMMETFAINGKLGLIAPFIEKWGLDFSMKSEMKNWVRKHGARFSKLRRDWEAKQEEDEEESLLNIL